jgi:hypothetical protein
MNNTQESNLQDSDSASPTQSSRRPTELELLEIAKKWHTKIHSELGNPIIPDDLPDEIKERKLTEITRQREKHKLYCRVLEKLIRTNQSAKES